MTVTEVCQLKRLVCVLASAVVLAIPRAYGQRWVCHDPSVSARVDVGTGWAGWAMAHPSLSVEWPQLSLMYGWYITCYSITDFIVDVLLLSSVCPSVRPSVTICLSPWYAGIVCSLRLYILSNFLAERYYVMFALWHGPPVCHLSVCEVRASNSDCWTFRQFFAAFNSLGNRAGGVWKQEALLSHRGRAMFRVWLVSFNSSLQYLERSLLSFLNHKIPDKSVLYQWAV